MGRRRHISGRGVIGKFIALVGIFIVIVVALGFSRGDVEGYVGRT